MKAGWKKETVGPSKLCLINEAKCPGIEIQQKFLFQISLKEEKQLRIKSHYQSQQNNTARDKGAVRERGKVHAPGWENKILWKRLYITSNNCHGQFSHKI